MVSYERLNCLISMFEGQYELGGLYVDIRTSEMKGRKIFLTVIYFLYIIL
jgi:hypothetical protein